ncbi:hypothetical protein [Halalkalibacter akibai]|uniref:Uncharacterized protein n=1 Tax=Halalkalibacter akibai (strain ATCC 43226 / DSM 21942 / CIP 109018 / JCM 9157 / 1139) TaxID=1236973 RepID=W4QRY3_HALA3|nr:hypothetical protein [Halalkalibacter akibai]GAE34860.1 hypothetical protein JCM9157_1940 [Halalkalibacter akibai JCM 9157]
MNKLGYMVVGAIFTMIISIGALTFADTITSSNANVQEENLVDQMTQLPIQESDSQVTINSPILKTNEMDLNNQIELREEQAVYTSFANSDEGINALKKLEIKIESDQTKIKVKQEQKKKKIKAEVEIELKNEKMKLKDQRAETFIQEILADYSIDSDNVEQLADFLLEEFQMNPHAVEVEIKIETLDGYEIEYSND